MARSAIKGNTRQPQGNPLCPRSDPETALADLLWGNVAGPLSRPSFGQQECDVDLTRVSGKFVDPK
jgi:hypothetical protein